MLNRRSFLQVTGLLGVGLVTGCTPAVDSVIGESTGPLPAPKDVTKYVDALPIPAVLTPTSTTDGIDYYEIEASEFTQQLHSELGPTTVWGYGGTYPGPTIEARTGTPIQVKFLNELPTEHLLPVDTTLHGAEADKPAVRMVTHLHGGHVSPEADGYPENWVAPGKAEETNEYSNDQQAATLWYHDHAMGITRLNVYAGLASFYIIRDDAEDALGLPAGEFEIPIVFQDRKFTDDGSLLYVTADDTDVDESIKPEDFGDVSVVNGKIWPVLEVEPRRYRLRLLNGSNSRFYSLALQDAETATEDGPALVQIGSDQGLLAAPVTLEGRLLMAPAERCDMIIDFAGFEGREFIVHSDAKTPYKSDDQDSDEVVLEEIMMIRVGPEVSSADESVVPEVLVPIERMDPASAAVTRELAMLEGEDEFGRLHLLLDGLMWDDPITEKPALDSTEVWRLINPTEDVHPIHLHLVRFQVIGRTPIDAEGYLEALEEMGGEGEEMMDATGRKKPAVADFITGPMEAPDPNEMGWKDTVRANPEYITDIIATYDIKGRYVWHCHILEHEDHEMMRPFDVV